MIENPITGAGTHTFYVSGDTAQWWYIGMTGTWGTLNITLSGPMGDHSQFTSISADKEKEVLLPPGLYTFTITGSGTGVTLLAHPTGS